MDSTIFVVDARSRDLKLFVASTTFCLDNYGAIVLRKAADLGGVSLLHSQTMEHPTLVVGEYQAKSSAGFVTQFGVEKFQSVIWAGGAGFGHVHDCDAEGRIVKPIRMGYGLRPFGCPLRATLLPAGTRVEKVLAHENSNPATAKAALAGLRLLAGRPRMLVLATGQSDFTAATTFEAPEGAETPDFPPEFRTDIFSPENIFNAAVRRVVRGNEGHAALVFAILRAAIRTGKDVTFIHRMPETVRWLLGDEEVQRIVEERVTVLETDGWKVGFSMEYTNFFTRAVSPDGTTTDGVALFPAPDVESIFLELSNLNSEEEKNHLRANQRTDD